MAGPPLCVQRSAPFRGSGAGGRSTVSHQPGFQQALQCARLPLRLRNVDFASYLALFSGHMETFEVTSDGTGGEVPSGARRDRVQFRRSVPQDNQERPPDWGRQFQEIVTAESSTSRPCRSQAPPVRLKRRRVVLFQSSFKEQPLGGSSVFRASSVQVSLAKCPPRIFLQ